jgi:hypothetical protein
MQKKTLFDFYQELYDLSFDKRKAQGLVKRANSAGYDIYYAYHEDGQDTWQRGWSEDQYKEDYKDVKIFEATTLIGKKKPTRSFTKAHTYTAECAIFIFCPLKTILEDAKLRERQINIVKNKAEKYAIADYSRAIEMKAKFDKWQNLPEENKVEINRLLSDQFPNMGQPGTAKLHNQYKKDKEQKISDLGGICIPLADWQKTASSFEKVEDYIKYKQDAAVADLLKEALTEQD